MTKVVNCKIDKYDFYCGRPSIYGNPFEIGRDGNRDEVISKYKSYFYKKIEDPFFNNQILKLKDKVISCWCKQPNKQVACHLDIIANYLDNEIK